jgi:hypothetical protein
VDTQTVHPPESLPPCFICGSPLRIALTRNRNGKVAVTLYCGADGRHLRAFVNHRPWVEQVVAGAEAAGLSLPPSATPADPALQKRPQRPARARSPKRGRPA